MTRKLTENELKNFGKPLNSNWYIEEGYRKAFGREVFVQTISPYMGPWYKKISG